MAFAALPPEVVQVMGSLSQLTGLGLRLWIARQEDTHGRILCSVGPHLTAEVGPTTEVPFFASELRGHVYRLEAVGGHTEAVQNRLVAAAALLGQALTYEHSLQSSLQIISDGYEEINLLYSISEILGSYISLEAAAQAILAEVISVLNIDRAALWRFDQETERLVPVAEVGGYAPFEPVDASDPDSVTANVFRSGESVLLEPGEEFPRADACMPGVRDHLLSIPLTYTPPNGVSRSVGVINILRSQEHTSFLAADRKIMSAVASQIGATLENARLVEESLAHERLQREVELARDLQARLLPSGMLRSGAYEIAARCLPATAVGGDLYHFVSLPGGRSGVLLGDVSGHGIAAALMMSRVISYVSVYAEEGHSPADALSRALRSLAPELEASEMYLTLFYGVLDPERGVLSYCNAGHPHAFRVGPDGDAERLDATDPPFGMVPDMELSERCLPWEPEETLVLFTDGLINAPVEGDIAGEMKILERLRAVVSQDLPSGLSALFESGDPGPPDDDRSAVLVRQLR